MYKKLTIYVVIGTKKIKEAQFLLIKLLEVSLLRFNFSAFELDSSYGINCDVKF